MDLNEERIREQEEIKNKKNSRKRLIQIVDEPNRLNAFSDIEKETMANE